MGNNYTQEGAAPQGKLGDAYSQVLPQISNSIGTLLPQFAQAQLAATQGTQGGYNQLNLDQLQKYGLSMAQQGQQITDSNAQAGAATNLKQLQGAGGDAARAGYQLNRDTNPDYYQAQDAASRGAASAVNAINLNGLSPGEAAATERANNQNLQGSGNLGLMNNTNAISNAMNFGGAFNSKVGLMNNAVGAASGAANSGAGNAGFNGVNVAMSQPNPSASSNFGMGSFNGANPNTSSGISGNTFGFTNSLLGNITSGNNALIGANATTGAAQIGANSPAAYLSAIPT